MIALLLWLLALQLDDAGVARLYLEGLTAARAAYAEGGSPDSLAPVRAAVATLERAGTAGLAPIAASVLRAAAAAAQSERDEMTLHLEHALRLELVQLEAGQPLLPGVSAHEAAGDLWLQVHGYEEARRAYERAAARIGMTPRIREGLARVCARLACDSPAR